MKIVNRAEFLTLPAGTVFMKFPRQPNDKSSYNLDVEGAVSIKEATYGNDFGVQGLFPDFVGADDSGAWGDVLISMIEGHESPEVDYYCTGSDGYFDEDQLFLVWNKDDLTKMVARLQEALLSGYSA